MKIPECYRNLLGIVLATLILALASPAALAQGRGNGRGRGFGHDQSWKCAKFVNCHDARDGRWDGRGPRRGFGASGGDIFVRSFRSRRARRFDDDDLFLRQRRFQRHHRELR